MSKATFKKKKKKNFFTCKLKKKLVEYYILSIAFCDKETWTVWKADQKSLKSFEM